MTINRTERRGFALDAAPPQFKPQDVGPLGGRPLIGGAPTRTLEPGELVDLFDGLGLKKVLGVNNGTAFVAGWSLKPGSLNTISPFGGAKQTEVSSLVPASRAPRRKP